MGPRPRILALGIERLCPIPSLTTLQPLGQRIHPIGLKSRRIERRCPLDNTLSQNSCEFLQVNRYNWFGDFLRSKPRDGRGAAEQIDDPLLTFRFAMDQIAQTILQHDTLGAHILHRRFAVEVRLPWSVS